MNELNQVYTERAIAAVLAAKMALFAGYSAGMGWDEKELAAGKWESVLFVDFPGGQISWHIAPHDRHLCRGLPFYEKLWDGTDESSHGTLIREIKVP